MILAEVCRKKDSFMQILIINGHPDPESYNKALADAYREGALASGASVTQLNLFEMDFNPVLKFGYRQRTELEPDLVRAIELILQADHLVWVWPMWWYGTPALLKGFIDRTFLPGIAFEYVERSPLPKKLLKGKTAHIIMTADTPRWYDYLLMGRPAINHFKKGVLEFCGISPVKVTYIAPMRNSQEAFRQKWLEKVRRLALRQ